MSWEERCVTMLCEGEYIQAVRSGVRVFVEGQG